MKHVRNLLVSLLLAAVLLCGTSCQFVLEVLIGDGVDVPLPQPAGTAEAPTEEVTKKPAGTTASGKIPVPKPDPAVVGELTELPASSYYGYQYLASLENPALTDLYSFIVEKAEAREEVVSLKSLEYAYSSDVFSTVFACYRADYPQHFWIESGYGYRVDLNTDALTEVTFHYLVSADDLPAMKSAFLSAADTMLAGVEALSTNYARELEIHDRIVRNAQYDQTLNAPLTHTAYANLVNKSSVCDGYAKLFQYLLYRCGILCFPVSGVGQNASGEPENHAWNVVAVDSQYYLVDVTWDDPVGQSADDVCHTYFNCTSDFFSADHALGDDNAFAVPPCVSTDLNYYYQSGSVLQSLTADFIIQILETQTSAGVAPDAPHEMLLLSPITMKNFSDFLSANNPPQSVIVGL